MAGIGINLPSETCAAVSTLIFPSVTFDERPIQTGFRFSQGRKTPSPSRHVFPSLEDRERVERLRDQERGQTSNATDVPN